MHGATGSINLALDHPGDVRPLIVIAFADDNEIMKEGHLDDVLVEVAWRVVFDWVLDVIETVGEVFEEGHL
jgi:hypothetical protein